ncbi:MAG TPA: hypothetical protein VF008_06945 [Niastella sp.]
MSVQMQNKTLDIHLSLEQSGDDIIAHVSFRNNGADKIYLDAWTICTRDVFTREAFSICDMNNDNKDNRVLYIGMMVKRVVVPEDFVILNPREEIKTRITVNKGYKLTKGKKYTIQYCAHNPSCPGKQDLMELWSNKVEIDYV